MVEPNVMAMTAEIEALNGRLTAARHLMHYLLMEFNDPEQAPIESLCKIGMELERYFQKWPLAWASPQDESGPGFLTVGTGDGPKPEVIINLDHDRTGHVTFSPDEARGLAALLMKKATEAEARP
jgi:hypothetical protein